ncbi:MAG: hypothetical protein JWP27_649 [Flaviaesturariibacter sp.]|nr:hypothetical protein [Flaviaesturariibacter sp.]
MTRPTNHLLLLLLLLAVTGVAARERGIDPGPPVITIGTLPGGDSTSCIIPFTRAGNLILVQATADTVSGNFILDTGAPGLVLNLTYFRQYPTTSEDGEQTNITGGTAPVLKTRVASFAFGTLHYDHVDADLANLGPIENSKGVKILGLLGMDLLMRCEMIIDYRKNLIYLHRIGRRESSSYQSIQLKESSPYTTVPIDLKDNRIITQITVGGKNLKFIIDCGAESTILDSRLPNAIFDRVTITGRVMLTGAGNKKIEALQGSLDELRIGGNRIGDLPVLITNLEKTCFAYGGCIDGILGFDFLSLQKIGFNFVTRKLYLWK